MNSPTRQQADRIERDRMARTRVVEGGLRERYAIPTEITEPRAKLVYLYLLLSNGSTPSELRERLGMSARTVRTLLESLETRGFVHCVSGLYTVRQK